jgi:hypothetical protein
MQLFSMGCFIFLFAHIVKMPQFYRSFGFLSVDVRHPLTHPLGWKLLDYASAR